MIILILRNSKDKVYLRAEEILAVFRKEDTRFASVETIHYLYETTHTVYDVLQRIETELTHQLHSKLESLTADLPRKGLSIVD